MQNEVFGKIGETVNIYHSGETNWQYNFLYPLCWRSRSICIFTTSLFYYILLYCMINVFVTIE